MLLTAVDQGLDACFIGVPVNRVQELRTAFAIPDHYAPIGTITIGYRAADTPDQPASWAAKRRPHADVVRFGRWST